MSLKMAYQVLRYIKATANVRLMTDRPRMLLGLEIEHIDHQVELHQYTYAMMVLRRFGIEGCNGRLTPVDPNTFPPRTPSDLKVDPARLKLYQSIIGSINFLAIVSRPDIAFTVSTLGTYNANPSDQHLKMAYQVLRHIKATANVLSMIDPKSVDYPKSVQVNYNLNQLCFIYTCPDLNYSQCSVCVVTRIRVSLNPILKVKGVRAVTANPDSPCRGL